MASTELVQRVKLVYFAAIGAQETRVFFFFSSRRRHTRLTCDWSSDVSLPISTRSTASSCWWRCTDWEAGRPSCSRERARSGRARSGARCWRCWTQPTDGPTRGAETPLPRQWHSFLHVVSKQLTEQRQLVLREVYKPPCALPIFALFGVL